MEVIVKKYEFYLAPGYCKKKGIEVLEQEGACIKFLIKNQDDEMTKERLRNAFCSYISFVRKQKDCSSSFLQVPKVDFIGLVKKHY